ncbi:sialidase family protein [Actinomadura gamaensis]|uniref:Sialidase family protein n=1 Tax=Actinomadura gamaensis TaxID=1763541 RepID=A0ABV9TXZ4_9ACTN
MSLRFPARRLLPLPAAALASAAALVLGGGPVLANVALTQVSSDPFTNTTSQHRTQVEPDTFTYGTTIVSAFQTGRFFDGGSSDICFATSSDSGSTWTNGCLPGVTKFLGGGPYDRVSDAAVGYDARHGAWLISGLAITDSGGVLGKAVVTSRSTDGGHTWANPVVTANATGSANLDKNWIVCDNTASSPSYGHCYTEYDDNGAGNRIHMATSTDGGLTWTNATTSSTGLGGQPVVRPNGTVLVPYQSNNGQIRSFRSTDGGATWRSSVLVSAIQSHTVAGNLRTSPLPSAEIDSAGTAYVVWQDCRFQSGCAANDIVMSKSTSETTWGPVTRVTADGGDHFIPGIGVDPASSGGSARLAVTYYRYPAASCTASTCQLTVGYTSSVNGGSSWSAPTQLAGPMTLSWLANTSQGVMVGDYISTSIAGGRAWPVIAVANAPAGGTFDEAMYVPAGGLAVTGGARASAVTPLVTSGHQPPTTVTTRR